jgi:hypothetical protein
LTNASLEAARESKIEIARRSLKDWKELEPIQGEVVDYIAQNWTRKIPLLYEELLSTSLRGESFPRVILDLLKAMTV